MVGPGKVPSYPQTTVDSRSRWSCCQNSDMTISTAAALVPRIVLGMVSTSTNLWRLCPSSSAVLCGDQRLSGHDAMSPAPVSAPVFKNALLLIIFTPTAKSPGLKLAASGVLAKGPAAAPIRCDAADSPISSAAC